MVVRWQRKFVEWAIVMSYKLVPLSLELYNSLPIEKQKELGPSVFEPSTAEIVLNNLVLSGCRVDYFLVTYGIDTIGCVCLQWYPLSYTLMPLIHYHVFKNCGFRGVKSSGPVIHSLCDHFGLDVITVVEDTMTKDGKRFFEICKPNRIRVIHSKELKELSNVKQEST